MLTIASIENIRVPSTVIELTVTSSNDIVFLRAQVIDIDVANSIYCSGRYTSWRF